jgi:hypothetical protein
MVGGRARRDVARSARTSRIAAVLWAGCATALGARTAAAQQLSDGPGAAPATAGPSSSGPSPSPAGANDVVAKALAKDELHDAGYIPGYRPDLSLSMPPYSPRVAALPGGVTPAYGAPGPFADWTFRWTGFFTASLQTSENERATPSTGQTKATFHSPPQTIDEYGSFLGTSTVPGQWAQMNFAYGNRYVTANLSLTTWNPTDASTFYQIGSEQFINNFYLQYNAPPILGGIRLHAMAGYFYNNYGAIGQYGLGMYTDVIVGGVRGVGEDLVAEYDIGDRTTVSVEDGVMGNRNGMGAINIVPSSQNGQSPIVFPSAWIHHFHVGLERRGDLTVHARLHYLTNWAQDDRAQMTMDDPQTRQIDESYIKDGQIQTYGADVSVASPILGYLGAAFAYTKADNAYPVQGLITFGGDGPSLTNRWFGQSTTGTGQLVVAGVNYSASIGRMVSFPVPFSSDGPDLALNLGFIVADSWSAFQPFDARLRYKGGADLLYTFLPYVAAGVRADVVVPNSHDLAETFYVLAPRLVFKSNWNSADTVTLLYGKWFYGADSHPEANSITQLAPGNRLDSNLFAINVQIGW